ncbi:hypothetical protein VIBHAR_01112 [Vibrio campbellii ATCC BAA-1116]|uniref:Uncharacterized protein n=1 Tax=Vibrio campbellii (strain ATCC BAA-1116) TaxID=2902295 RepID=A7MU06_VIBC1|nr:hypothetical protein VIBHAR_01112 [Vibrio campbellii ATCC BAA-1116]
MRDEATVNFGTDLVMNKPLIIMGFLVALLKKL